MPALLPPWRPLRASPEALPLGPCLLRGAARRLLTVENLGPRALAFSFDLGPFSEGRGVVAGRLAVRPAAGVVAPGKALVCQVLFEAGG